MHGHHEKALLMVGNEIDIDNVTTIVKCKDDNLTRQ